MKKIFSVLLSASILLSLIILVSAPVYAVDGQWTTYGPSSEYADDYTGDPTSIPGYEYTDRGLHVIPADWTEQVVFGTVQTKDPVVIEEGIYMEFEVDVFDGADADNWFSITVWDQQTVEPGTTIHGKGVMTLVRIKTEEETGRLYFDYTDWYTDAFRPRGQTCEKNADGNDVRKYLNEDGTFKMYLEIKNVGGKYVVTINGAVAPDGVSEYISRKFADGSAYVGVTYRHGHTGGTVDMTITKFGTSREDAVMPDGTDSKEPVDYSAYHVRTPIGDPNNVPEGQPCFLLTGNLTESATKRFYGNQGGESSVGDDFTMHIVSPDSETASFCVDIKNDISYDIDDFPVMLMLTKNFCTCEDPDECFAVESVVGHLMTGDQYTASSYNWFPDMEICWNPIIVEEGDKAGQYIYFTKDFADPFLFNSEGRINSIRFDVSGIRYQEAGRNSIDVVFVAFFRNNDEALAYVYNYLGLADEDPTTEVPGGDTTEAPGDVTTEKPGDVTTEKKPEQTTEKKPVQTDAPAQSGSNCKSVIGAGAVAVIAMVVTCGAVVLKKKED